MGLFSKAAAHGLAALIDIRCKRYARGSPYAQNDSFTTEFPDALVIISGLPR
jgi:hypothetical protein